MPEDYTLYTDIFIFVMIGIIIIYDIFPFVNKKLGDTISERIQNTTGFSSFFPYAWGLLFGHFFGGSVELGGWYTLAILPLTLVLMIVDFYIRRRYKEKIKNRAIKSFYLLIYGVVGYCAGAFLWSLNLPT